MAPQRQTTRGKTLLFCHTCRTKISGSLNLKMDQGVPKNLISISLCLSSPQCKNEGAKKFEKPMHFCDVHFSIGEKQILQTRCIKEYGWLVDPLRDLFGLSSAHTLIFVDPPEGGLKPRTGLETRLPRRNFEHLDLPKEPISAEKGGLKEWPFGVLKDERVPGRVGHPVDTPHSRS